MITEFSQPIEWGIVWIIYRLIFHMLFLPSGRNSWILGKIKKTHPFPLTPVSACPCDTGILMQYCWSALIPRDLMRAGRGIGYNMQSHAIQPWGPLGFDHSSQCPCMGTTLSNICSTWISTLLFSVLLSGCTLSFILCLKIMKRHWVACKWPRSLALKNKDGSIMVFFT